MSQADTRLAEAAMHRVLRRTLPAQRHDVLGALSALKLQLAVARRRAQRPESTDASQALDVSADTTLARLAQLEAMAEQQLAAQTALTELRLWDGNTVQRRALDEVLAQCLDWVRQAAALRGHRIESMLLHPDESLASDPDPDPGAGLPWVEVPAAHYLVLGLLYAVIDTLGQRPACLVPQVHSDALGWRLSIATADWPAGESPPSATLTPADPEGRALRPAGQPAPTIDGQLLAALAAACSHAESAWSIELGTQGLPALRLVLVDEAA
jgi:hypothetical protein